MRLGPFLRQPKALPITKKQLCAYIIELFFNYYYYNDKNKKNVSKQCLKLYLMISPRVMICDMLAICYISKARVNSLSCKYQSDFSNGTPALLSSSSSLLVGQ